MPEINHIKKLRNIIPLSFNWMIIAFDLYRPAIPTTISITRSSHANIETKMRKYVQIAHNNSL